MENLRYERTEKSPAIDFNAETGILSIQGESWMENAFEFFKPLLAWIEEQNKSPKEITECIIDGNDNGYRFNDASSKCLLDVFRKLENIHGKTNRVIVKWNCYTETDVYISEDYQSILKLDFEFIDLEE